MYRHLRTSS